MAVKPIPDGYPRVNAYLVMDGAAAAIDFYKDIFGATERMRMPGPDGRLGHAELQIGDSVVMLADEFPDMDIKGPSSFGGCPITMGVYVEDVDATVAKALAAGATTVRPIQDQFYGDRSGMIKDPFGYTWAVQTHIEDVPPDEMAKRAAKAAAEGH
jgi:PhnB protein